MDWLCATLLSWGPLLGEAEMDDLGQGFFRAKLGLLLFGSMCLGGGAVLEATFSEGTPDWIVTGVPVLALLALAAYVVLVYLPQRRMEREFLRFQDHYGRQCNALKTALEDLRRGDLVATRRHETELSDDFRKSMRFAVRSLEGLIGEIQKNSIHVARASVAVHRTAADLASGSSEEAAAVVEITSTMEEVARTAAHIASRASIQAELAAHSEEAGVAGAEAVIRALDGMESMRGTIDAIAARAEALGKRSREIYGILELINEIAQETHILSLNAGIEAKAAGEFGERFGVVADEVRRLAERSRESVDSVRRLLDDFSGSLRDMVAATDEGRDAASGVLEQARSAAHSIEKLRGALTETAQASQEISLATSEQRSASDQVVTALREISSVVQRTAEGLQELSATADKLDDLGLAIQLLTQSFRLKSPRSLKHVFLGWAEKLAGFAVHGEAARGILDQMVEEHPYVEFAYLVDRAGVMVAFAANRQLSGEGELPGDVSVGRIFSERPWFQGVMREGIAIVTPPYKSLVTGQDCFTVAVAVVDDGGEPDGVLGVDINVGGWARI